MKLINLRFVTDNDESAKPVDRFVLVDVADSEFLQFTAELEDAIAAYMEAVFDPLWDTPWTKAVEDIMGNCGRNWIQLSENDVRVIRI